MKCGVTASRFRVSLWGDEKCPKIERGDGCTTLNILKTFVLYTLNG